MAGPDLEDGCCGPLEMVPGKTIREFLLVLRNLLSWRKSYFRIVAPCRRSKTQPFPWLRLRSLCPLTGSLYKTQRFD